MNCIIFRKMKRKEAKMMMRMTASLFLMATFQIMKGLQKKRYEGSLS